MNVQGWHFCETPGLFRHGAFRAEQISGQLLDQTVSVSQACKGGCELDRTHIGNREAATSLPAGNLVIVGRSRLPGYRVAS